MDDKAIEKLEKRFQDLSGLLAQREQEAADLETRRAGIVAQRAEASGKRRQDLAGEFGQVDAELTLASAEVEELRARAGRAYLAILEGKGAKAQEELDAFDQSTFRPALEAHEAAKEALRRASNVARTQRDNAQETREAIADLQRKVDDLKVDRQLAAARRRELQLARDHARDELEAARREAA
jgi:chromosome segregation ATPase